jgi:glycosyltransferase involved in cell wall biosynthesis
MRVSVVIPAYNAERFLREAIDSAIAQTVAPIEVIVVDDGSTDGTAEVLASCGGVVRSVRQENGGVSSARNHGARLAVGDAIAFLDADDVWHPQKLERQLPHLEDARVGLVHCGVHHVDEAGAILASELDGMSGSVARDLLLLQRNVVVAVGSTALLPREVFELVGGFDEEMSTSADWDLAYRIATRWEIAFVAEPLASYRQHGAGMHLNPDAMQRDMKRGMERAFASESAARALRRPALARLHVILAASYLEAGQPRRAFAEAARSVGLDPRQLVRALVDRRRRFTAERAR